MYGTFQEVLDAYQLWRAVAAACLGSTVTDRIAVEARPGFGRAGAGAQSAYVVPTPR